MMCQSGIMHGHLETLAAARPRRSKRRIWWEIKRAEIVASGETQQHICATMIVPDEIAVVGVWS